MWTRKMCWSWSGLSFCVSSAKAKILATIGLNQPSDVVYILSSYFSTVYQLKKYILCYVNDECVQNEAV
jgi:hypothetical protein